MDQYADALQAAESATKVKRWAQPVKTFGYIVIFIAALVAVVGVLGALGGAAVAAGLGALVASALVFLQGSVVLMLAHYMHMRADETLLRVTQILTADDLAIDE